MARARDRTDKGHGGPGNLAQTGGQTLVSYDVGALPILNRLIERMRLPAFLREFLVEDKRCTISPVTGVLLLLRNYLVSREPVYGIADWARPYRPDLLGIEEIKVTSINDDRVGRCLDQLFAADCPSLVLAVTRHVIEEFRLELSEIHNDSTTVTFHGEYAGASKAGTTQGRPTPAITWGHNKDHRPDLKQLLYNLTISSDGGVPIVFGVEDGNTTDDTTHRANWDLVCQIAGGPDFLYVADSKLATKENMSHIAARGGRFVSVLPRSRGEDQEFRDQLVADLVEWKAVTEKHDEHDQVVDTIRTSTQEALTADGFRLLWFHSSRKLELDRQARAKRISRGFGELSSFRLKLSGPRTRYTTEEKVRDGVKKRLAQVGATEWIKVEIIQRDRAIYHQDGPGRPGPNTRYRKEVKTRFDIRMEENRSAIEAAQKQDGVFPLVTNDRDLSAKEALGAYKGQPNIEKRFSQFKSQFDVAPVLLKSGRRVVALLTVYYFVLVVQALLEREVRRRMHECGIDALPIYPEERECKAPTTRRIIDLFDNVQQHRLKTNNKAGPTKFATELSNLQRQILALLHVPTTDYDA
jgi:transposase